MTNENQCWGDNTERLASSLLCASDTLTYRPVAGGIDFCNFGRHRFQDDLMVAVHEMIHILVCSPNHVSVPAYTVWIRAVIWLNHAASLCMLHSVCCCYSAVVCCASDSHICCVVYVLVAAPRCRPRLPESMHVFRECHPSFLTSARASMGRPSSLTKSST